MSEKDYKTLYEKALNYQKVLMIENEKLKQENILLKRTIKEALIFLPMNLPENINLEVPKEETESWAEKADNFKIIDKKLLETVLYLVKTRETALHYDDIIHAFKSKNPSLYNNIKNPSDTLSRRLRFLRAWGYLISPKKGYFFLGPKIIEEFKK